MHARLLPSEYQGALLRRVRIYADFVLKPNSITLASSELAPNMFGASSELVRSWFEAEIWPII